jgi:hypothetical protein
VVFVGGTTPLGVPWWVVLPTGLPSGAFLASKVSSGPEKISKKFGLRLVLIFCEVKKQAKNSNWH